MSKSTVLHTDYHSPDATVLAKAVKVLDAGGIVVAPTETRYGLLARSDNEASLRLLYEAKGRGAVMPTALFVRNLDDAAGLGEINMVVRALAEAFLPGPLTLVLKAIVDRQPPLVVNGKIGVRISSAPVINQLLRRVTYSLSATSANLSGAPEPEGMSEIVEAFGDAVGLYIDSGPLAYPVSTVVDCSGDRLKVLRTGSIADEAIFEIERKARA